MISGHFHPSARPQNFKTFHSHTSRSIDVSSRTLAFYVQTADLEQIIYCLPAELPESWAAQSGKTPINTSSQRTRRFFIQCARRCRIFLISFKNFSFHTAAVPFSSDGTGSPACSTPPPHGHPKSRGRVPLSSCWKGIRSWHYLKII